MSSTLRPADTLARTPDYDARRRPINPRRFSTAEDETRERIARIRQAHDGLDPPPPRVSPAAVKRIREVVR